MNMLKLIELDGFSKLIYNRIVCNCIRFQSKSTVWSNTNVPSRNLRYLSSMENFNSKCLPQWITIHMSYFDVTTIKKLILVFQNVLTQIWCDLKKVKIWHKIFLLTPQSISNILLLEDFHFQNLKKNVLGTELSPI